MNLIKLANCLALCAALVACGGGGDGVDSSSSARYPVRAAMTSIHDTGIQKSAPLTGTVTNANGKASLSGSITFTQGKATETTFNGAPALRYNETVSFRLFGNGQEFSFTPTATTYLSPSYEPLALVGSGTYCIAKSTGALPVEAKAGETGIIAEYTCYSDSSMKIQTEKRIQTFVTSPGSARNTLNVLVVENITSTLLSTTATASLTYTISIDGGVSLTQIELFAITPDGVLSLKGK